MPREHIIELLARSPEFTRALVHEISDRLREFNRQYIRNVLQNERLSLIGRFASSIVHDLKNPLTIINMAGDLACSETGTAASRKVAKQRIRKEVDRITYLVNDILEFTRGANLSPVLTPMEFAEFIDSTIEDLREDLKENKIALEMQSPPPKVKIAMNPQRLGRVFHNLIGNACKYASEGTVRVEVVEAPDCLTIRVADEGPGIPPQHLERIFDRFERLDHEHMQAGTGLGLYISRQLAQAMGGELTVESEVGHGAVFSLRLPAEVHLTAVS